MPWCPECKNEYVEGVETCKDCGCMLVESLALANRRPLIFGTLEEIQPIFDFLLANGFSTAALEPAEEDSIYELFVHEKEKEKADRAVRVYQQQLWKQKQSADQEEAALHDQELEKEVLQTGEKANLSRTASAAVYQKSSEKAEDFKSSAYVLLVVGILGLAALIGILAGVLPIRLVGMNRYLIGGVMGAMFVLFIVMGALSLRSSKILLGKAAQEDELTKEIRNWCGRNLTAEVIDQKLFEEGDELLEEEKYFRRVLLMKESISHQFMNLDESYLEQLIDEYYQEIFETADEF